MKKHIIPLLCVVMFFVGSWPVAFVCPIQNRVLYIVSHGNILHLALNILAYYQIGKNLKWKNYLIPFVVIGILSGFAAINPTIGMSGALMGLAGIATVRNRVHLKWLLLTFALILLPVFFSHIAWTVHLAGYCLGIFSQLIIETWKSKKESRYKNPVRK